MTFINEMVTLYNFDEYILLLNYEYQFINGHDLLLSLILIASQYKSYATWQPKCHCYWTHIQSIRNDVLPLID